ncbi:MAG: HAMP domain-containing sensor histidine kinase [Pseudomonadota bacterium]
MTLKLTLARQLALILALAIVLLQVFGLFLERAFESDFALNRSLGLARNHLANSVPVLAAVPDDHRQDIVRSYSTAANQFFLLPEIITGPNPERLPELEAQTREWIARRGVAVTDVYAAHHFYPRANTYTFKPKGGVSDRQSLVFAPGNTPRVRMGDVVAKPPSWVPIAITSEGPVQKDSPTFESEAEFELREIITVALRLEDTGEWILFYHYNRPSPNNDAYAKFNIGMVGALLIAVAALLLGRRVMVPFERLAKGATQLGRGDRAEEVPLSGPSDVRAVIGAFNRMNDRVSQSIDYQIGLLRSLGHDIKGPLAAAHGMLGRLPPDHTRTQIENQLDRAQSIVESIMHYSRAVMRDGELEKTDLAELLETLADEVRDNGGTATLDAPDGLQVVCRVDATERAFRNLMDNAIAYGGGVHIRLTQTDDMAVAVFDDDGPGIPVNMLDRVFSPFVRLDEDERGSGLGLAIVRTIALDQGGSVRLENRPECGLRATFELPMGSGGDTSGAASSNQPGTQAKAEVPGRTAQSPA